MAIININNLKQYFLTGLKPTQQQFWNLIDSLRHKNDLVPAAEVDGLQSLLDQKLDGELYIEGFNVVRVMQVEETLPQTVDTNDVAIQFSGNDITNILFDLETSKYLLAFSGFLENNPLKIKLFNITKKRTLIANVSDISTNQGQTKITIDSGALAGDVEEADVLSFELDFGVASSVQNAKRSFCISFGFLVNTVINQDGWYSRSSTIWRGKHSYVYDLKSNLTDVNDFADDSHVANYYDITPFKCKVKNVWLKTTQNGGSSNVDYAVRVFEQDSESVSSSTTTTGVNSKIVARKQLAGGFSARLVKFSDQDLDKNHVIEEGSMFALYFKRTDTNSIPLQGFNLILELEEIL